MGRTRQREGRKVNVCVKANGVRMREGRWILAALSCSKILYIPSSFFITVLRLTSARQLMQIKEGRSKRDSGGLSKERKVPLL